MDPILFAVKNKKGFYKKCSEATATAGARGDISCIGRWGAPAKRRGGRPIHRPRLWRTGVGLREGGVKLDKYRGLNALTPGINLTFALNGTAYKFEQHWDLLGFCYAPLNGNP